jgi:proteasome lid subunit RPN8/RPN11
MDDLWRRGGERREAGAFLLAPQRQRVIVARWISYDELDADSLQHEYVQLEPRASARLWEFCNTANLRVIADIHTHPHAPRQSDSDRAYPMIAIRGHVALIAPRFARGMITPADVSFNVYCGAGAWVSFHGDDAAALIVAP